MPNCSSIIISNMFRKIDKSGNLYHVYNIRGKWSSSIIKWGHFSLFQFNKQSSPYTEEISFFFLPTFIYVFNIKRYLIIKYLLINTITNISLNFLCTWCSYLSESCLLSLPHNPGITIFVNALWILLNFTHSWSIHLTEC